MQLECLFPKSKAGLTLNDLYDTTCMTQNQLSNFSGIYAIIQVVHTKFIKVNFIDYPAIKTSSKMIQKQPTAAVIIALTSEKKRKKEECVKL